MTRSTTSIEDAVDRFCNAMVQILPRVRREDGRGGGRMIIAIIIVIGIGLLAAQVGLWCDVSGGRYADFHR